MAKFDRFWEKSFFPASVSYKKLKQLDDKAMS